MTVLKKQYTSYFVLAAVLICGGETGAATNSYSLNYRPAPADNPLKGFFPYAGTYTTFPHSMEWGYLPLRSLMTGPTNFDWTALDNMLDGIARRGHQTAFRIYLDYPSKPTGIPQYLLDAGLTTRTYTDYGNGNVSVSPDYENPLLREALTNFIDAFGARYDGDPRVGFITVGLLGFWGEWHTYPYDWWFASLSVQNEVLTAYGRAFSHTRLLVRKPAGSIPASRAIGYHDDSFAYETLDPPNWTFLGLLKAAGETNKWQTQPIGGEVRPEVQLCMWDTNQTSCVPAGQEYNTCVDRTHASWMLNHRAFAPGFNSMQKDLAVAGARRLGYELYVSSAELSAATEVEPLAVALQIRNCGVAPFYYEWLVLLRALKGNGVATQTWTTPWKLPSLLPAATNTVWSLTLAQPGLPAGSYTLVLGVPNPLTNGVPLRFANDTQDADVAGWLTLGQFTVLPGRAQPLLQGRRSAAGFDVLVAGAAPGLWSVEYANRLGAWTFLASTNTTTSEWTLTDEISAAARFYRVVGPQAAPLNRLAPPDGGGRDAFHRVPFS
ncbi:MAG TPA: DUF4832 domain-containing protein, partial [Verrucomicrobiae bacterium]